MLDVFIGGVHTSEFQDRDNGGPECAEYMSLDFKITITMLMVKVIKIGSSLSNNH